VFWGTEVPADGGEGDSAFRWAMVPVILLFYCGVTRRKQNLFEEVASKKENLKKCLFEESLKKRKKKCLKKFVSLKNWKKSEDKEEKHLEEMVNAALVAAVPNPGKVTRISTYRQ